jgi:hypothetical protein
VKGRVLDTEKGKRFIIIIIHAMTRFGMLEMPIDVDDISDNFGDERTSATVVYLLHVAYLKAHITKHKSAEFQQHRAMPCA